MKTLVRELAGEMLQWRLQHGVKLRWSQWEMLQPGVMLHKFPLEEEVMVGENQVVAMLVGEMMEEVLQ